MKASRLNSCKSKQLVENDLPCREEKLGSVFVCGYSPRKLEAVPFVMSGATMMVSSEIAAARGRSRAQCRPFHSFEEAPPLWQADLRYSSYPPVSAM